MCSRPFRPLGFSHLCRSRPRGSVHLLLPSSLYVDRSHCPCSHASYLAALPSTRDFPNARVPCRSSHSLYRSEWSSYSCPRRWFGTGRLLRLCSLCVDSLTSRSLSGCLGGITIYPAAARLAVFYG